MRPHRAPANRKQVDSMEAFLSPLIIPLGAFVVVAFLMILDAIKRMREAELDAYRDLRIREMEHLRRLKELDVEHARATSCTSSE
jgi:hypothetical protein